VIDPIDIDATSDPLPEKELQAQINRDITGNDPDEAARLMKEWFKDAHQDTETGPTP